MIIQKFLRQQRRSHIGVALAQDVSIPLSEAVELCQFFRSQNGVRLFSQCWGCMRFSKGQVEKMCFYNPPINDGCGKVNELYKKKHGGVA
jgi:hypothetical protein